MGQQLSNFMQRFAPVGTLETDSDPQVDLSMSEAPDALGKFMQKFGGVTESYWFYNHTIEIRFDPQEHRYFKVNPELGNLIPLDGVTTVCHIIDRSPALVPWSAKKVVEKLLSIIPTYINDSGQIMLRPLSFEEFTKIALDAKTAPKDELEDAGDVGHMAHKWLEDYIRALKAKNTDDQKKYLTEMCKDERATSCVQAALSWMRGHNVRWTETERKIYSDEHGYAGTTDGRCLVDSCSDPICCPKAFKDRLSIIDWKSSNYLYIEYLFQTAAYEHAEEEELGLDIQDRWVLRLGKEDGKFEPWHLTAEDYPEDFAGYLACLNLYRLVHSVEERMKIQKQTKRAAKKEAKTLIKELAEATEKAQKAIARAQKKLERELEKQKLKEDADKAKEQKRLEREQAKAAIKAAKPKKKSKLNAQQVAGEAQVLLERTTELSPKVAALLAEAHTSTGTQMASEGPAKPSIVGSNPTLCSILLDPPKPPEAAIQAVQKFYAEVEAQTFAPLFKLPEEVL